MNLLKVIGTLKKNKISFFCGVPDSILKDLSIFLDNKKKNEHVISTNEGSAVSLGAGYYLATKKLPCVYFQNSGLGNAINPLASITHKKVYSIPMLLIIGWRGSPNSKDEPQHMVKGQITRNILKLLGIKYIKLKNEKDLKKLSKLIIYSKNKSVPVACLVENKTFNSVKNKKSLKNKNTISRSKFIDSFLKCIPKNSKIVATTGYTSRELFHIRNKFNIKNSNDFYMVGGMGHASILSLGYSLNYKNQVFCLDGDGSLLMHMGALRTIGKFANKNFKHIIFNNNAHESVGGQRTSADTIDFRKLVKSIGYKRYFLIKDEKGNIKTINNFINLPGPSFLEVKTKIESIKNIGRPKNLIKIKNDFKSF